MMEFALLLDKSPGGTGINSQGSPASITHGKQLVVKSIETTSTSLSSSHFNFISLPAIQMEKKKTVEKKERRKI